MSFKKELISGVSYIAVAKYSGIFVQLVITSVLARLLTPEDFGIVAIATVIIAFFNILSDIGIGPAIIQNKELTISDLNSIYSFTVYLGGLMAIVFFCLSYPIASYYNNKLLIPVCQLLSIPILFQCVTIVPLNLQYKQKSFKFISITTLLVQIVAGCLAVVAALINAGLYALLISQIVSACLLFVIYYNKSRTKFNFKVRFASLKKIMSFSIYQFLFNVINYFSRNLDKLLVGKYIGMYALGFYEKSYRLMMMPLQNITFVITPVMQPLFSSYQDDYKILADKYVKLLSVLAYIAFPISVVLYFISSELVLLLFGTQWTGAIPAFKILSLTVGLQILTSTSGAIYQSANSTKNLFISGCWCAFFMVTSFIVAVYIWGTIEAVACGFLVAQIANTMQCFYLLFKTLHYPINRFLKKAWKPLCISLLLFICCLFSFKCLNLYNGLISLVIKMVLSFIMYAIFLQLFGEYKMTHWKSVLRK